MVDAYVLEGLLGLILYQCCGKSVASNLHSRPMIFNENFDSCKILERQRSSLNSALGFISAMLRYWIVHILEMKLLLTPPTIGKNGAVLKWE